MVIHAKVETSAPRRPSPRRARPRDADAALAHLGAPLPAPPEAAPPPAYKTPGLGGAGDATSGQATPGDSGPPIGAPFVARGVVYGSDGAASGVTLQARKPTTLVVHGPDGAVYFARQLQAGEAWRAPAREGLIADVGNPASIEVFVSGLSRGPLTDAKTALARIEHQGGDGSHAGI